MLRTVFVFLALGVGDVSGGEVDVDQVGHPVNVVLAGVPAALLHSLLATTLHPDEGFKPVEDVLASGDPLVSLPEFAALVQQLLKPHKALI